MDLSHMIQSVVAFFVGFVSILWTWYDMPPRNDSGFATKTAYRHCGLQSFTDGTGNRLETQCHLLHINALFRHGTRSPSEKDVAHFEELYDRLVRSSDATLPEGFREHPIPFKDEDNKQLLPMGYQELYNLGQRFRNHALNSFTFNGSNIRFVSSSSERAVNSGRSFYHGFFGQPPLPTSGPTRACQASSTVPCTNSFEEPIKIDDHLLRFFDYCERYRKDIEKNKSTAIEHSRFLQGPEIGRIFDHVMLKHNLNSADFTFADMYTLYVACAFETAANPDTATSSPWCKFFEPEHFMVLEYLVDLKQYWRKSYGYELNYVQSCPLVGQMLIQLRNAAKQYKLSLSEKSTSPEFHRATFSFGHAETLLPVVAALGLFNDTVGHNQTQSLLSSNFDSWLRKSQSNPVPPTMFRSGYIAPFAGNIALYLYYCPHPLSESEPHGDPFEGFYVRPEVNEKTVAWPVASPVQPPTLEQPGANSAPLSSVLNQFKGCLPGEYDNDKVCKLKHRSPS